MLTFHEYSHKLDFVGDGWHLYSGGLPTSYFFFKQEGSDDYELSYGNGFFVARSKDLEAIKNLAIEIFEYCPLVIGSRSKFDAEAFEGIKALAEAKGFDTKIDLSWLM